jgi:hypothetical protein
MEPTPCPHLSRRMFRTEDLVTQQEMPGHQSRSTRNDASASRTPSCSRFLAERFERQLESEP